MSGYPMPVFSYHEALLVSDYFLQDRIELCMAAPPPDGDMEQAADSLTKENWAKYERIYTEIREAIGRFAEFLGALKLPSFLRDVDKTALASKIKSFNESQRVQLYFAVNRYFWDTEDESRASALARAGLIDPKKLPIARQLERFDRRLIELERNGIKFS
jgi:hypothetical protein